MSTPGPFHFEDDSAESADWIKQRWDVPGSPHFRATVLLGKGTEEQKQKRLEEFLTLPVAKFVDEETRRQCALMGHPWPEDFPQKFEG